MYLTGRSSNALLTVVACVLLLPSQPALAQVVTGEVREALTEIPIDGGEVFLIEIEWARLVRQTATDSSGRFRLVAPAEGSYLLYARRLGYQGTRSDRLYVAAGDTLRVNVRLFQQAIEMDSLTVTAERLEPHLADVGFYDRQQRGWGHYVTREEIERRGANKPSDLLYGIPGVRVLPGGTDFEMRGGAASFQGSCYPSIVVDGMLLRQGGTANAGATQLNKVVTLAHIGAIEVYTGAAGIPVQYAGTMSPCGAILVWTVH